jgi:hypothetical protein
VQELGGAAVGAGTLARWHIGVRAVGDHRVDEPDRAPGGRDAVDDERVERRRRVVREPREGGDASGRVLAAEHRERSQRRERTRAEGADTAEGAGGHGLGSDVAAGAARPRHRLHQQRRAPRRVQAGGDRRRALRLTQHPRDTVRAERLEPEPARARSRRQARQQGGLRVGGGRSRGHEQRDGQEVEPPRGVLQCAQRRRVAPVGVVDAQQQRPALREGGDEPMERVRGLGRRGRGRAPRAVADDRLTRRGRAGEDIRALARGQALDQRVEKLPGHGVRGVSLGRPAGGDGGLHSRRCGQRSRGPQQACLAHAQRRLDDDERADAVAGRSERFLDRRQRRSAIEDASNT